MIELLAITDDPSRLEPPLRAVLCGPLAAICAPSDDEERLTEASLWRHEERIEQLMRDRDLLPVRFGTRLADEHAAAEAVRARQAELAAGLDRVRGAVELALRLEERGGESQPRAESAPRAEGGAEYMRAKARRLSAADAVHRPLARRARDAVVRAGPELLRAAYLVDRDDVPSFVEHVRELQAAHPDLDMVCTGPWPPYSFAEERRG